MPSVKPKIVIRTTEEIKNKFDEIAKKENRSASNLAETILTEYIKQYVENYEKSNGAIVSKSVKIDNSSVNNGNISL